MNPVPSNQMSAADIPKPDQASTIKTIYQVSGFEVFWRNFIAGMGRALGAAFVYFIVLAVLAALINEYLMPHLSPLIKSLQSSFETLNNLNTGRQPSQVNELFNQDQFQNILKQVR